jgi:hypothetical protein
MGWKVQTLLVNKKKRERREGDRIPSKALSGITKGALDSCRSRGESKEKGMHWHWTHAHNFNTFSFHN